MGSIADQYQDRPAGDLFCFGIPRILIFQNKIQLYKAKIPLFYSCFLILLFFGIISISNGRCSLFRFSTIIYLLSSYCK